MGHVPKTVSSLKTQQCSWRSLWWHGKIHKHLSQVSIWVPCCQLGFYVSICTSQPLNTPEVSNLCLIGANASSTGCSAHVPPVGALAACLLFWGRRRGGSRWDVLPRCLGHSPNPSIPRPAPASVEKPKFPPQRSGGAHQEGNDPK